MLAITPIRVKSKAHRDLPPMTNFALLPDMQIYTRFYLSLPVRNLERKVMGAKLEALHKSNTEYCFG